MAATLPNSMRTYEETIGIQGIGRRLSELKLEGLTVVEKPGPHYPLYYILDRAPYEVAKRYSGNKDPWKLSCELLRKETVEYREWISQNGYNSGIVLDLHDNTAHPDVWIYQAERFLRDKVAYKTKDGFIADAINPDIDIGVYSDTPRLTLLREMMKPFKPRTRIDFQVDFDDTRTLECGGFPPLSDVMEVSLEYYPVRIHKWPDKVKKMSAERALQFTVDLISFLRTNYARYISSPQNI